MQSSSNDQLTINPSHSCLPAPIQGSYPWTDPPQPNILRTTKDPLAPCCSQGVEKVPPPPHRSHPTAAKTFPQSGETAGELQVNVQSTTQNRKRAF